MLLQELRSPKICSLQTGHQGEPVMQFLSKSKCLRTRRAEGDVLGQAVRQAKSLLT